MNEKLELYKDFSRMLSSVGITHEQLKILVRTIRYLNVGKGFSINGKYYAIWKSDKHRSGCRICDLRRINELAKREGKIHYKDQHIQCPFFFACTARYRKDRISVTFIQK